MVADVVDLAALADEQFELIVAMGDVLSICSDAGRAIREMRRVCKKGGVVIATADNKLAAVDYYFQRGDIAGLESFLKTGRTHWLTDDVREQFELTTFTPGEFSKLVEQNGMTVVRMMGKTVLPIRTYKEMLEKEGAFDLLMRMELDLGRDATAAGRAGHLQVIARERISGK